MDGLSENSPSLLELSSIDDLAGFKRAVEEEGLDFDEPGLWYGRRIGSKRMGFEERTPLMVAAMFGSGDVLTYILQTRRVDPNRACGSDGATALHCAAASGSCRSLEVVKLLVEADADISCVDANGNRPADLIAHCPNSYSKFRKRAVENMLRGEDAVDEAYCEPIIGTEKKEYPVDPSLPDIKTGMYTTDEFRMYTFKVRPCSRAYSHDWTECPFVHPGENARRRDPRKIHYSCVPCPEFRKGACTKGDACDYAHGIFECWLHPAQYRTRLCKDDVNCSRRVCFFAHKPEELRPVYASTGSAVPSPRSMSSIGFPQFEMASLSPISTPPMTPNSASSSPMWPSQFNNATPPALQLSGSRLKTSLNARDLGFEGELMELEKQLRRQQLLEELAGLSSSSSGYNSPFANTDHQLRSSYSPGFSSPTLRASSSAFGIDPRSAAFAKRSHSFIDRRLSGLSSPSPSSPTMTPSHFSDWGSPSGKLEWGIQGEELDKLRKSASFGIRGGVNNDAPSVDPEEPKQSCLNLGGSEMITSWAEQFYLEQQQMVA